MTSLTLSQLHQRYEELYAQHQRGQLTYDQFIESAHQLQAQDAVGNWWTIDPVSGSYSTYKDGQWMTAQPPQQPGERPRQVDLSTSAEIPRPLRGAMRYLSSPLAVGLMSFGAAGFWYIYTSLSPSSEGSDLLTPLTIGGLPLLLRFFQGPMDRLLAPLFQLTNRVPRTMRTGAAFGLPMVLGLFFSVMGRGGYSGLQMSVVLSVLGSYALTRRGGGAG